MARATKTPVGEVTPAGPASLKDRLTMEEFNEIVEVFRILARWRDEERRKALPAPGAEEA